MTCCELRDIMESVRYNWILKKRKNYNNDNKSFQLFLPKHTEYIGSKMLIETFDVPAIG